jgi:asparagine synthase (glutamine-hydrolysing)
LLRESVQRHVGAVETGCFLSGGTDSSTVTGVVAEVTGRRPRTFSIGFDAEGYDEMQYARIAARHFNAEHHEYYVTPDDLVRGIPEIASWYEQPFGNSSVLPAYYCAKLAKDAGIERILAGDGGDELFGGNSRYAKQRVFGLYEYVPATLRKTMLEPALLARPVLAGIPGIKKAVSYVEQASVPMPARMEMYNLLMRLGITEVLTQEFLSRVDPAEPLRRQVEVYSACASKADINRMLAFDWRYTLADNDLPKVVGSASLAGIAVGFPLLDDALVDFSLRLEPRLKLKGLKLRWFFKEALRGFLPDEIIVKKKHGFGLPFGLWLTRHAGLRAFALDSLDSLRHRGIVRSEFLDRLTREYLPAHPGYFGEMVWILMMLEQWFRTRNPRCRDSSAAGGTA